MTDELVAMITAVASIKDGMTKEEVQHILNTAGFPPPQDELFLKMMEQKGRIKWIDGRLTKVHARRRTNSSVASSQEGH